jgi:uncharacterized protein involved in copper resistance
MLGCWSGDFSAMVKERLRYEMTRRVVRYLDFQDSRRFVDRVKFASTVLWTGHDSW